MIIKNHGIIDSLIRLGKLNKDKINTITKELSFEQLDRITSLVVDYKDTFTEEQIDTISFEVYLNYGRVRLIKGDGNKLQLIYVDNIFDIYQSILDFFNTYEEGFKVDIYYSQSGSFTMNIWNRDIRELMKNEEVLKYLNNNEDILSHEILSHEIIKIYLKLK